ncbi:MAG: hypothetical protein IPJ19_19570 [Planctomycetes bacterium]|nr:hypothetical protein [Planctomycetota bacterium]
MAKRSYQRRSEDERIKDLEAKVAQLREKLERKQRTDGPVLKEFKKLQKLLHHFAITAHEHQRADIGNMVDAFTAGLGRQIDLVPDEPRRRSRAGSEGNW